jgi:hypothetical protein
VLAREGLGTGYGEIRPSCALSTSVIGGWLDSDWDAEADPASATWAGARRITPGRSTPIRRVARSGGPACARGERARAERVREPARGVVDLGAARAPAGRLDEPYLGLDAGPHDYIDATFGVRVAVWRSVVLSLGVFKALNSAGVRPDGWSPVGTVEGTF